MTQEEKAKAYDEAIETARKLNNGEGVAAPPDWTVYEVIFPELRKSEDEKIRKILIELVKTTSEFYGNEWKIGDYSEEQVISWLEKQGEQKSYGQRQECIDCQFSYAGECKGSCAMKRSEQKPAGWSEKDEERVRETIEYLEELYNKDRFSLDEYYDKINWLKSLKDKYTWKPSDEQMKALADCPNSWLHRHIQASGLHNEK